LINADLADFVGTVPFRSSDPGLGVMLSAAYTFTARTATPSLAGMMLSILRSTADLLGSRETQRWEPFAILGTAEAVDELFADGYDRFGK
jgi:hypothetical protein